MKECLIVIASYADGYLDDLLNSIKENTTDVKYEIQVVDNNPDIDELKKCVTPICIKHNIPLHLDTTITGYGDALNTGVEINPSTSKYILYMDSDTKVAKGWLREMINCFERHTTEHCGLVGPLVKNFENKYLPEMTNYTTIENLEGKDYRLDKSYLVGVCYLRERATLDDFKWDKNFLRAYSEDNDFTRQVNFWDYSIFVAGKALMYHKVNSSHASMKKQGVQPQNIGSVNYKYLLTKWHLVYKKYSDAQFHKNKSMKKITLGTIFEEDRLNDAIQ